MVGYIQFKPHYELADDLKQWEHEQKKSIYNLLSKVNNISDPTVKTVKSKFNFDDCEIKTIPWISYKAMSFKQTQQMPTERYFKVEAKIKNVDGKMFFVKENKAFWRLKVTLCDDDDKWFRATAFEIPAKILMKGLEAGEAKEMCEKQPKEFGKKIENLLDEMWYLFGCHMKENTYFNPKRLEFVIDEVQKL